ncbi:uncharacterized protein LOC129316272 [Prosopis cineraria]|uniref:uncharacterized protein LOC129316272 n=1 Tax=Prosopis cineraria TaxID=364024 RepID=UPI0024103EE8|nr:uncharacterized protein LOC129316272 [Prosopis cineraria]
MDKYLVNFKSSAESARSFGRRIWERQAIEVNGRFDPNYRHQMFDMLVRSYSEVGAFPHLYHVNGNGEPCQSHVNRLASEANTDHSVFFRKQGISAVDFDKKGIYLVSVTKSGCLTVHDFESLYCRIHELKCLEEDESKHVMHLSLNRQLDVVQWNPLNQDEVVCASVKSNEVLIFDVGYISSEPVEVLRTRQTATVHGSSILKGLSDIALMSNDSKILASDTHGGINVWDRRVKALPCLELASSSSGMLNSIQLNAENQIIFGAGKDGMVYVWDIRGGRASSTFQSHKEACHPPMMSLRLASLMDKIESLKAQSDIIPKEIHSINLNPSCPYQLAFHLDDGWSGVLDIYNLKVTHIHCPPPAWLNDSYVSAEPSYIRKPSWLSACSIYVVGSSSECGIHLLDFYPSASSSCHVDFKEDKQEMSGVKNQNRFVGLSEGVTACAIHPLYNAIIAGTKYSSLLMISQKRESYRGGDY